jgi:leucyl aminopeptidase (aminopeptidase T)
MSEEERLLADVVNVALRDRVKLKKGENVTVETWGHGMPLAREFVHGARALGAHPMLMVEDEEAFWRTIETLKPGANKAGSHEWAALKEADAYVFLTGPADITRVWKNGARMGTAYPSNDEWYARAARAKIRGVRVLYGYATKERADAYGIDHASWRRMILEGATVPPAAVRAPGKKLTALLKRGKTLRIAAPNGTELRMDLAGRDAQLDDGSVSPQDVKDGENMTQAPAGQVWVAPSEATVEGHFIADCPSYTLGRPVDGAEFEFKGGKLMTAAFKKNGEAFDRAFGAAKGHKDRVGMVIFGLNPKLKPGTPQDAIAAGVVTLSIGYNEELGGKNDTSFQFLAPLSGATVEIGNKKVIDAGRLTL